MKHLLFGILFALLPALAHAMEFRIDGETIHATGVIETGDAAEFTTRIAPRIDGPFWTVTFDSPGGSLIEGMRLGEVIHDVFAGTLVESGRDCLSACAIAFLGGRAFGTYAHVVRREIEPGSRLGYHGFFSAKKEQVALVNEVLDQTRLVNALLLDYAARMRQVDGGNFAKLLTTAPADMEMIDTSSEIADLGISLVGDPLPLPKDWARTACRKAVQAMVGAFADAAALVGETTNMLTSRERMRQLMLDDRYPAEDDSLSAIRAVVAGLDPDDAIDLLAGQPIDGAPDNPPVRVELHHGGGFLGDACYATADASFVTTLVVNGIDRKATLRQDDALFAHEPGRPLW